MDFYFFDSNALVKNYVQETGTNWVKSIFNSTATKIIAEPSVQMTRTSFHSNLRLILPEICESWKLPLIYWTMQLL